MGEVMDLEPRFSPEQDAQRSFILAPFDTSRMSETELAKNRAFTTTHIKESMQNYLHLSEDVKQPREVDTRGDYVWTILHDLNMVNEDRPTKSFRKAYASAHDKNDKLTIDERSELMEKYDDHPFVDYIRTLNDTAPNDRLTKHELAVLYRSSLVLLDEYS